MTVDRDAALVSALRRVVFGLLTWLSDYPDDQVAPDALATIQASIDWVIEQLPGEQRDRLVAGDPDPASLKAVTGLIVDLVWWLDTCYDDEVDPDVAVKLEESCAAAIDELPDEQRQRLLDVLDELTITETHPGRQYELRLFPFAMGLADDEPDTEEPAVREWVAPDARATLPPASQ